MQTEIVSLGGNCEIAFQLERRLGRTPTSPFNWCVTPLRTLHGLLSRDFAGLLQSENIVRHDQDMCRDDASGIAFHAAFKANTPSLDPGFEEGMADVRSKFDHMIKRFRSPAGRRVYLRKIDHDDNLRSLSGVVSSLSRISDDFDLVLLVDRERSFDFPRTRVRKLERFAPLDDAQCGHVESWDRVLDEFIT